MPLQIHPTTPRDAPRLTTIFLAAFSDAFNHALFPRTADVREWWTAKFARESLKSGPGKGQLLLKVVDTSPSPTASSCVGDNGDGGEIVAFGLWKHPIHHHHHITTELNKGNEEEEEGEEEWPPSSDATLCERFFGGMAAKREKYMGSRPHYYLDILATHPTHHGRGIASQLLRWGLERADRDGLEVFLSASPAGRPIYEKKGFWVVEMEEVARGYVQAYMIREPM